MKSIMLLASMLLMTFFFACTFDSEEELFPDSECDAVNVSFSNDIDPIIQNSCATVGCHVQGGSGPGIYDNYAAIKAAVDNGRFEDRVLIQRNMPPVTPLSECQIEFISAWVADGAPNN